MINKASANQVTGMKTKITKQELKERIEAKLMTRGISNPEAANDDQIYQATVYALKDIMLEYREDFKKRIKIKQNARKAEKDLIFCAVFSII